MLTSSVYTDAFSFFTIKKCQKIQKIDENSYCGRGKSLWKSSEQLDEFQRDFQEKHDIWKY